MLRCFSGARSRGASKNKHRALPFLAAISVREKDWMLDQTDWHMAANAALESEFRVDVHCPFKFRDKRFVENLSAQQQVQ